MKRYKVLLVCINADFGQEGKLLPDESNASWEKVNFYPAWKQLHDDGIVELETPWCDQQNTPEGYDRLLRLSKEVDFVFQIPVTHWLGIPLPYAHQVIDNCPIVSFHPDMHLRYKHPSGDGFVRSRLVERYDTHFLTPAKHTLEELRNDGMPVQLMPFGIPAYSERLDVEKKYDVTFVGQMHGIRDNVMSQIRGAGIEVHTWGHFWKDHANHHGRPSPAELNQIFNESRINLNFRWCSRDPNHGQIKGRDLEVLGCGNFMLATQHEESDDFHELYTPDKEFVEYHFVNEMIDGIKYYLEHEEERQAICDAAYLKREENLWTTRLIEFLEQWGTW